MSWLRGTIIAAIAGAAADYVWQRHRDGTPGGPKVTMDYGEVAGAGVATGAVAALWAWTRGKRR